MSLPILGGITEDILLRKFFFSEIPAQDIYTEIFAAIKFRNFFKKIPKYSSATPTEIPKQALSKHLPHIHSNIFIRYCFRTICFLNCTYVRTTLCVMLQKFYKGEFLQKFNKHFFEKILLGLVQMDEFQIQVFFSSSDSFLREISTSRYSEYFPRKGGGVLHEILQVFLE